MESFVGQAMAHMTFDSIPISPLSFRVEITTDPSQSKIIQVFNELIQSKSRGSKLLVCTLTVTNLWATEVIMPYWSVVPVGGTVSWWTATGCTFIGAASGDGGDTRLALLLAERRRGEL